MLESLYNKQGQEVTQNTNLNRRSPPKRSVLPVLTVSSVTIRLTEIGEREKIDWIFKEMQKNKKVKQGLIIMLLNTSYE